MCVSDENVVFPSADNGNHRIENCQYTEKKKYYDTMPTLRNIYYVLYTQTYKCATHLYTYLIYFPPPTNESRTTKPRTYAQI